MSFHVVRMNYSELYTHRTYLRRGDGRVYCKGHKVFRRSVRQIGYKGQSIGDKNKDNDI